MTPEVRELAMRLTDRVEGAAPSALWPSLYRHLANWPSMLGLAAVIVEPAFPRLDAAAARLSAGIDAAVTELSGAMPSHAPAQAPAGLTGAAADGLGAALASFSARIPEMVMVGALLAASMPAPPAPSGAFDDRPR